MSLRWKKEPRETGLRAVTVNPDLRPSSLSDGTTRYATVACFGYHRGNRDRRWYWSAPKNGPIPHANTSYEPVATEAEAKAAARAYIESYLKATHD